jgi:hypothetical protein
VGIRHIQWALDDVPDDLPPMERLTLVSLAEWARDETGQCWPGREALARRLRRSPSTVERNLRSLINRGLVEIVKGAAPGRHPVYQLNVSHPVTHERESSSDTRSGSTCLTSGTNVSRFRVQHVASGDTPKNPQEPSAEPSDPRARANEIAAVIRALQDRTGRTIDEHHAGLVVNQLLDGRRDEIRTTTVRYLTAAIAQDPNPRRFLPTPGPPRYQRHDTDNQETTL